MISALSSGIRLQSFLRVTASLLVCVNELHRIILTKGSWRLFLMCRNYIKNSINGKLKIACVGVL